MENLNLNNKKIEELANMAKEALSDCEREFNEKINLLKKDGGDSSTVTELKGLFAEAKSGKLSVTEFMNRVKKYNG